MEAAVRSMSAEGFVLSLLFGIPDFYDRFGYAPFAAAWRVRVNTRDAERLASRAPAFLPRMLRTDDLPFVVDLHNEGARRRGASVARDTAAFRGFSWGTYVKGEAPGILLESPDGERVGWFAVRDAVAAVQVIEAAALHPSWYPCILAEISRMAARRDAEEITLELPGDDAFARFLVPAGCRIESDYPRSAGPMARILDQGTLLRSLRSTIERRFVLSGRPRERVLLRIETDRGTTTLHLGRGSGGRRNLAIRLPQAGLAQLVTGFRSAGELTAAGEATGDPGAVRLLDRVFRGPVPFVWQADRF
jgi:predicted acetyltransferase